MWLLLGFFVLLGLCGYRYRKELTLGLTYLKAQIKLPDTATHFNRGSSLVQWRITGQTYELFVPRGTRTAGSSKTIILTTDHGTRVINHPPGVPFLVTPRQLGGKVITVSQINMVTGETTSQEWTSDQVPQIV